MSKLLGSKAKRLESGLEDLLSRIEKGEEFPDACGKAARDSGCDYDALRQAYDNHCMEK